MTHYMHLDAFAFNKMASGKKNIELRLNDGKRQKINVGDYIVFTTKKQTDRIKGKVDKLHVFSDFKALYEVLPLNSCGYDNLEEADYKDMYEYYSKEQIEEFGVLGIVLTDIKLLKQKEFVLASGSPRRKELLLSEGYTFRVVPSTLPEEEDRNLKPQVYVENLAKRKALDVFEKEKTLCLAGDTIVVFDGKILEKPADKPENANFLRMLSGKSHYVYTGYAIVSENVKISGYVKTEVVFNDLTEDLINDYVNKGYGLDKAGGYGIQNEYPFVKEYIGSFTNVVGLPTEKINELLKELLYDE